jgi:HTH-type transcriptional regulator, sugar sensing transcriptional regulator
MNLDSVIDQLSRLGFSQPEARAYLALLGKSPATGYEVAKNSGLSRGQIYETLGRLESTGAVQRSLDGKYIAMPFRELAHDKLATVRDAIKEVEQALPQLSVTRGEAALIVYGYANLILRALEIVQGAARNVFLACFPPELEKLEDELIAAKQRGVNVNILSYGDFEVKGLDIVQHHGIFVVRTGNGGRSFHLVADRHAGMMGVVREIEEDTSALWSRNEYFCTSVMKYVAADMSILRIFEALPRAELHRLKRKLNTTADRIGMVGVPGIVDDPMELIEYWQAS